MTNNKKPKIAILTIRNTYNYGGVLSSLKVVYAFCEKYFTPTVFFLGFDHEIATNIRRCKFTSSYKPMTYFNMNCIEIGARWSFWEPGHYRYSLDHWKNVLNKYDYFFVVSGTCIAAHPLVLLNKKFIQWIGTPYLEDRAERVKELSKIHTLLHTQALLSMLNIEKQILKSAHVTLAISSYAYKQFQKLSEYSIESLKHCVFPIDSSIALKNTSTKESIIIAVGRFADPRKNVGMLMRVFEKIHASLPDITLYVIGLKPTVKNMIHWQQYQSFNNVVFTGQISDSDLVSFYQRASLILITSHQEGFGIVGPEALLHGTPIVATECGGTSDYVINNETGFLVAINDDEAMTNYSIQILTDQKLFQKLSKNGYEYIKNKFSYTNTHTSFKDALTATYPELVFLFNQSNDLPNQSSNTTQNQTIIIQG